MTHIGVTKLRSEIADVLSRVPYRGERVILERNGKPVAALIPVSELEFFERMEDYLDDLAADEAEREAEGQPLIPFEEIKRRLGLE
jgi:prevent-host-death family protein